MRSAASAAHGGGDAAGPVEATDQTFDKLVTKSHDVVVVDFYADWCAPCRMLTPVLTKAAAEAGVKLVKVNADTSPESTDSFAVRCEETRRETRRGMRRLAGLVLRALSSASDPGHVPQRRHALAHLRPVVLLPPPSPLIPPTLLNSHPLRLRYRR